MPSLPVALCVAGSGLGEDVPDEAFEAAFEELRSETADDVSLKVTVRPPMETVLPKRAMARSDSSLVAYASFAMIVVAFARLGGSVKHFVTCPALFAISKRSFS